MKYQLKDVRPNPFRRSEKYPILKEKVEELVESIETTGFWENIVGRDVDGKLQVAYGHHRLEALKKVYPLTQEFDWRVRKLSDGTMVQMMARENSEAYKQNADVLLESIRATVQALAEGKIEIGKESGQMEAPAKNNGQVCRFAPSFVIGNGADAALAPVSYSAATLGKFLGINALGGSSRLSIALNALELIEVGCLPEKNTRGITITELKAEVDCRTAEREQARRDAKRAAEEKEILAERTAYEKKRKEDQAIAEAKRKAAQAEADKAEREAQTRRDAARKAEQKADAEKAKADAEKTAARKSKEEGDRKQADKAKEQAEKAKAEAARARQAEADAEKVAKDKQKAADKARKEMEDKVEREAADKAKREAKDKADREAEDKEEAAFIVQQRERKRIEAATIAFMYELVSSGRKALALKHHPDQGGSTADMVLINAAAVRLNTIIKENV
jgi:DNA repair exonuclease SbcCD ATPase subunit